MEQILDLRVSAYRAQCFTQTTKQSYISHRKSFLLFCAKFHYQPLPVSTITLCRYAAHLAERLAYNSIKQYLNIVRIMHLEAGLTNPLKVSGRPAQFYFSPYYASQIFSPHRQRPWLMANTCVARIYMYILMGYAWALWC